MSGAAAPGTGSADPAGGLSGSAPAPRDPSRHLGRDYFLPLLALTLLVGALGSVAYWFLSADIREETQRTLTVIAEEKRQQIEDWLAQARGDGELYFSGHSQVRQLFGQWLDGGRQDATLLARIRGRMEELARVRGWAGFSLLDAAATPILEVGETAPGLHREQVKSLMDDPHMEFTDLHAQGDGRILFCLSIPIGTPGAPPLGVALLTWRADRSLFPLVAAWPVPTQTAETYLVRRDGDQVRFLTPLRFHPDAELNLTRPLGSPELPAARALLGQRGLLERALDYRGVPVLAYVTPIAGTPWAMVAEIDRSEANAGLRTTAWITALVMGLALLLVYSAGYLLWYRDRQRRALAAVRARHAVELQFRTIVEQAPIGVVLVDRQTGLLTHCNERFAQIVGRSREDLDGFDRERLIHPDDLSEERDLVARLRAGKIPSYRIEKRYLRPDGTVVWVDLTAAALVGETGPEPHYLALVEDITERKEAEERLHCITEGAHDAILMMDAQGRISYWNPAATQLLGYTAEEALGRNLHELLAPARYLPAYQAAFPKFQHDGEGLGMGKTFPGVARHKNGEELAIELSLSVIQLQDGWNSIGIMRDIRVREQMLAALGEAKEAAERANAAKSLFLANMSHEIRTPMNAIVGMTELGLGADPAPRQRHYLTRIRTAANALRRIIDDILDFSKIEAGRLEMVAEPFTLEGVLDDLQGLLAERARAAGLELAISLDPDLAAQVWLGDGQRLGQVLTNLVSNAIKFSSRGQVQVSVAREAPDPGCADGRVGLRFAVRDQGIGIAPADQARLFQPFTQADASTTRTYGGTGLGLAISRRLVGLMGGEIGLESIPGQGSTFSFSVRFPQSDRAAPPRAIQPPDRAGLAGLRGAEILVVEDTPLNEEVIRDLLEDAGLRVRLATNGQEALAAVAESVPDAVLMDCQMPVMDGFEATRRLRADPRYRDLPIVALTANALATDRDRCLAAGMNGYLSKPLDFGELYAALLRWVRPRSAPPPPQPSDPSPTAPWTLSLPGLDTALGLAHSGDKPDFYGRLLRRFRETGADGFVERFRQAWGAGDLATAARLAHTLKGSAWTLGAKGLAAEAEALEEALDEGAAETVAARLGALESELAGVLAGLAGLTGPAPGTPDPDPSGGDRAAQVRDLLRLLEEDDTAAADSAAGLAAALAGSAQAVAAAEVAAAAARYDFAAARAGAHRLAQSMGLAV